MKTDHGAGGAPPLVARRQTREKAGSGLGSGPTRRRPRVDCRGFSLAAVLIWTFLLTTVVLALHLRLSHQAVGASDAERQLYSLVLAENGVEYARTVLPHLELDSLLNGPDGRHSGTGAEWRDPMPYARAQSDDPARWRPERDDGIPFDEDGPLLPGGYRAAGRGWFFLRFSNNPEEPPQKDSDQVVLVRSLGVAPGFLPDPGAPGVRNAVTLVEARLRKETVFALPSPVTLFGDQGEFSFDGAGFLIDGKEKPGVSVIETSRPGLEDDFRDSLGDARKGRVRGAGTSPSIEDATEAYRRDENLRRIYSIEFWKAFVEGLPDFSDLPEGGVRFLPDGGEWSGSFKGLMVSQGRLVLRDANIQGLLLHLGGGELELTGSTRVAGGLWISNLDHPRAVLPLGPLRLQIGGAAKVVYDEAAVRYALGRIPPTQLGWRILFPEMAR